MPFYAYSGFVQAFASVLSCVKLNSMKIRTWGRKGRKDWEKRHGTKESGEVWEMRTNILGWGKCQIRGEGCSGTNPVTQTSLWIDLSSDQARGPIWPWTKTCQNQLNVGKRRDEGEVSWRGGGTAYVYGFGYSLVASIWFSFTLERHLWLPRV